MKISVVIPTYNRREVLAQVLPTVFDQDIPSDQREVVVVVDGSTDGTAEYLRTVCAPCRFTVVEQPNRGPASARNTGVRASSGNLVLFLDDDIRCAPTLLAKHAAAHVGIDRQVVFGPVLIAPDSPSNSATDRARRGYEEYWERLACEGGPASKYDVYLCPNTSLRRALFLEMGGYDEAFRWAHEDAEIALRLWDAGIRFRFDRSASVYEYYDKTPAKLIYVDAPRLGRSEVLLCRRHPDFRAHSALGRLNRHAMGTMLARLLFLPTPSAESLFRGPFWVAEHLRAIPLLRGIATALLRLRFKIVSLRSGLDELGSWQDYRRLFAIRGDRSGEISR
jgi:glycosyltransferase involved in cell wall biosynthesis